VLQQGAKERAEVIQPALKGVEDVVTKWQAAQDTMDYTKAKANYEAGLATIKTAQASDNNPDNLIKYQKQAEDLKKDFGNQFHNKELGAKAKFELDHNIAITNLEMGANANKKKIEQTDYLLGQNVSKEVQKMSISIGHPILFNQVKQRTLALIESNRVSGIIDNKRAEQLIDDVRLKPVETAIYNDPANGAALIKAGGSDLTAKEKTDLTIKAQKLEKSKNEFNDWQIKQARTQTSFQLSEALANNTLTSMMVRDLQQSGRIDSETAAVFDAVALNKAYEIPNATSLAEPDYFLRLLTNSLDNKVEVNKVLKDAAEAYGKGKLGINQYTYFVQNAKEIFGNQTNGIKSASRNQEKAKFAVDVLKSFIKTVDPTGTHNIALDLYTKFVDRVFKGGDPEKVKTEVIDEQLDSDITKSKMALPKGTIRMLAPDCKRYDVSEKNVDKALSRGLKIAK
jgi:hypothetical protein